MEKRAGAEASKSLHDLRSEIHRGDWVVLPPSFAIVFASQPRRAGSTRSGCSIKLAIVSPLSLSGMWWQGKVSCRNSRGTKLRRLQSPSGLQAQYFSLGQDGESSKMVRFRQLASLSIQNSG